MSWSFQVAEDAGVELPVGEASNAGGQPSGTGVAAKAGVQYSANAQIKNSIPFMRSLIVFLMVGVWREPERRPPCLPKAR